jgi:hypothetical protein
MGIEEGKLSRKGKCIFRRSMLACSLYRPAWIIDPIARVLSSWCSTCGKCNCLQQSIRPLFDPRAIHPGDFVASTIVLKCPIRVSESTDCTHRAIQVATQGPLYRHRCQVPASRSSLRTFQSPFFHASLARDDIGFHSRSPVPFQSLVCTGVRTSTSARTCWHFRLHHAQDVSVLPWGAGKPADRLRQRDAVDGLPDRRRRRLKPFPPSIMDEP